MDYVMRIFKLECKRKEIRFQSIKYRIRTAASTSRSNRSGNIEVDWIGYADDLILFFNDSNNLQLALETLNQTFEILI